MDHSIIFCTDNDDLSGYQNEVIGLLKDYERIVLVIPDSSCCPVEKG